MIKFRKAILLLSYFLLTWANINAQVEVINNPERGVWQDRQDSVLSFELVQVYGTDYPDDNAVFSSANGILSVDTDEFGNVYVLDNDAHMLVKFSPDGEVLWKVDQKGKGPGDLFAPDGLAVGDSIFLSNQIGTRLDLFDMKGQFLKTISINNLEEKQRSVIGIIEDRYLVLGSGKIPGKIGIEFTVLDILNKYKIVSEFEATEDVEFEIPGTGWIYPKTSIIDGLIVMAKSFHYGFNYYTMDGTLVREINRDASKYKRPGFGKSGGKPMLMALSSIYAQHKIENGYLLNFVSWPTKIDDPDKAVNQIGTGNFPELGSYSSLDLYSPGGKLLHSSEMKGLIPEIGWLKHADDTGYLYTVVGVPYTQVRKYKVNVYE